MINPNPHQLAGKTVKIKANVPEIGGNEIRVEDYWDRVSGQSWMDSNGNPAALMYAMRSGISQLPTDDNVIYGRIGSSGHIVHESELEATAA